MISRRMGLKLLQSQASPFRACLPLAGLLALLLCLMSLSRAQAEAPQQSLNPGDECVVCHSNPQLGMQFSSGEIVSVYVDPTQYQKSAHGGVLQCTACHPDLQTYPHTGLDTIHASPRDITFLTRTYTQCGTCHAQEYQDYLSSTHAQKLAEGKTESAICSDCHGDHNIPAANAKENGLNLQVAVYSCAPCHQKEFDQYKNSVHGKALLENGDPNVPACVDCHGIHNMGDSTKADFRRKSVAMCANCHADQNLMTQYGLSTNIVNTYVADFHGTTSQLFTTAAGQAPKQAVCYDCHGAHEILSMAGSSNQAVTQSLLVTCQKCHTDASINFPAAWLGHHPPSPVRFPLVFWIQRIYAIVIGVMVVGFVGHILLDISRVTIDKVRQGNRRRTA